MFPEPFTLKVEISRPDVVEWLRTVPPDKLPPVVENTLAAGNMVLSLLQASTGEESMQRFFRPVLEPMGQLKDTIDNILRATQKSQRLGELGEDIVVGQLGTAFPGDHFEVVSTLDHQADIHASFGLMSGDSSKALVEVKFYSDDVPSHEVEKFRRDLEETGFGFGLMVSLTSRLAGITGPLHIEETSNYVAMYVPSAGLDGYRLLCATAMLKAIVLYRARSDAACLIPAGAIEQAWGRLNSELQELKEVAAEVHDLRNSLQVAQQSLTGIFGKVTEKAISAECRLRYALERVTNRVAEELFGLPRTTEPIALLPPSEPDAILTFMATLRSERDGRLRGFEAVFALAERLGLQIRLNEENHWQLLRGGCLVAWTDGTKTRLDACVPFANPEISVDTRFEKIKNSHVVIDGKAVEQMLARLEERIG